MAQNNTLKKFHKEAKGIHELGISLDNISHDDKKDIADYTQQEVVAEAKYVLSTFYEGGHCNNDELGDEDQEVRRFARKQVGQLKRFIKRYSKASR